MAPQLDPEFLALPLSPLADAALSAAADLGVEHADFRLERLREQDVRLRDHGVDNDSEALRVGFAVRVIHQDTYGFAASDLTTAEEAARVAREAVAMARLARPLSTEAVRWAGEPVYPERRWVSSYERNPFDVPGEEKLAVLQGFAEGLLASDQVDHVEVRAAFVQENKFYADTAGTRTYQQRVRSQGAVQATRLDPAGDFQTLRTLAPPVGRGWEWFTGGWDWPGELAQLPELLAAKAKAASVTPGRYDLVIDPSNLWLTIHESIGHATELDRALGYEAAYAGTSFATLDQLGALRYGSEVMQVTGDRTEPHGLATVGFDDEGVAAQRWQLIRDGVLVGYQLDRRMAALHGDRLGVQRSNGCAYADSPGHVPVQRMANVSLAAAPGGPSTDELIAGVQRGIYVVGDKSWSIDMQRYNFQFTGQRFYEIRNGALVGQLRDVAYQATTTEFWGSLEAVGGEQTYVLGGAFNCGKAQPGQVAAVSHGCPSALFRGVNVLNTVREGGR